MSKGNMAIKIFITGEIPEEAYDDFKRWEHHIEYTGITENYPELINIHCEVSKEEEEE